MPPPPPLLFAVMTACVKADPNPLYPSDFVQHLGVDREQVDAALDFLRLNGMLHLTDWAAGKGQGYRPTEMGLESLRHPERIAANPAPQPRLRVIRADSEPDSDWEQGERARAAFLEPKPPRLTKILIGLNIAAFVFGLVLAMQRDISPMGYFHPPGAKIENRPVINQLSQDMGNLNPEDYIAGEWWRLFSYQFLHSGLLHLFMNMFALYSVGPLLENAWGWKKFLLIYLYSGLFGGCVALVTQPGDLVGASGSFCGIMVSLGVWVYLNRQHLGTQLPRNIYQFLLNSIVLIAVISFLPNVSWAGHLGGAIGGALLSIPLNYFNRLSDLRKPVVWLLPLLLVALVPATDYFLAKSDVGRVISRSRRNRSYLREFQKADDAFLKINNEVLVPLVNNRMVLNNPDYVEPARLLLRKGKAMILIQDQALKGVNAFDAPEFAKELESSSRYMANCRSLIETLEPVLAAPPGESEKLWHAARKHVLQLEQATLTSRATLYDHKILPPPPVWTKKKKDD